MARIIESGFSDNVEDNFKGYRRKLALKYIVRTVCAAALCTTPLLLWYALRGLSVPLIVLWSVGLAAALTGLLRFMRRFSKNGLGSLKSGYRGEQRAIRVFKKLPKTFLILPDVQLRAPNGQQAQADCVVCGPTGVFVFEIKNHAGSITLTSADKPASQTRRSSRGNEHKQPLENPIPQSLRITAAVAERLKRSGIKIKPVGAVFFSGRHTTVTNRARYPVFYYARRSELYAFLRGSDPAPLTENEVFAAAKALRAGDARGK